MWMPSNSGAACTPICSVTSAPNRRPCATNFVYPRRFISVTHARAMRVGAPAGRGRLAGESVTRHRWNHHMERVRCARRHAPWDW